MRVTVRCGCEAERQACAERGLDDDEGDSAVHVWFQSVGDVVAERPCFGTHCTISNVLVIEKISATLLLVFGATVQPVAVGHPIGIPRRGADGMGAAGLP